MSRIGTVPIYGARRREGGGGAGNTVTVTGPKGTPHPHLPGDRLPSTQEDGTLTVTRPDDCQASKSLHGLSRTLITNMVLASKTASPSRSNCKALAIASPRSARTWSFQVGYSHPVQVNPPDGISFAVEAAQSVSVSGIDKQIVGQVAANIRSIRKPEPYKGKGIRYRARSVRMKAGKAGKVGGKKK